MKIFNFNLNFFSIFLHYFIHKKVSEISNIFKQIMGAAYKRVCKSDKCEGN